MGKKVLKSKTSKIDQIFDGIFSKKGISAELQPYYDKVIEVQTHLRQGWTTRQCIQYIVSTHKLSEAYAYEIHNDAAALFGRHGKLISKEADRQIHIEKAIRQQQQADENGNIELWFKLEQHICKLKNLTSEEKDEVPTLPPVNFLFSSNTNILIKNDGGGNILE